MREAGFLDPPEAPAARRDEDPAEGFIDPLICPRWIVQTPAIPGLPGVATLLAAVEALAIGGDACDPS